MHDKPQDHLDAPLVFVEEETSLQGRETLPEDINGRWTVLIVDDEEDVHKITRITLKGFTFQGRGLRLLSAYSGDDVKTILAKEKDVALVLLDVVMEEEDTGLKLVEYIRNDLENNSVRIVLRTGQPGKAPEQTVISRYDINDYKTKPEFTAQKLFTCVTACLRAYENLKLIERNREGLESIINSSSIGFDNIWLAREIINTQKEVILTLGEVVETRSQETAHHVTRVAECCYCLAKQFGMDEPTTELLRLGSPMHDVGKIGVPEAILHKPGKLTFDEFEIMKKHAQTGYEILRKSNSSIMATAAIVAHQHHERWDGQGYPQGLKGKNIHVFGRIAAIADVFDALSHKRCYKDVWPLEKIMDLFKREAGFQFDPELVAIFLTNINEFIGINRRFPE